MIAMTTGDLPAASAGLERTSLDGQTARPVQVKGPPPWRIKGELMVKNQGEQDMLHETTRVFHGKDPLSKT